MSKLHHLFTPVLTSRRGKSADKKSWHNLLGSSSTIAIYQAAIQAETSSQQTSLTMSLDDELRSLYGNA